MTTEQRLRLLEKKIGIREGKETSINWYSSISGVWDSSDISNKLEILQVVSDSSKLVKLYSFKKPYKQRLIVWIVQFKSRIKKSNILQ